MNNQRGYVIKIVLIVFAIIMGLLLFPIKFPDTSNYSEPISQSIPAVFSPGGVRLETHDSVQLDWFEIQK